MLAKLFGLASKKPSAATEEKAPDDALLQARIRTFVKTNVTIAPVCRYREEEALAFVTLAPPAPVLADHGGNPPPPVDQGDGSHGRMPPLREIYLTPEAMASDDPYAPIQVTIDINNYLMQEAGHKSAELPEAARQAYAVDYYRAQVLNGGHGQFIGNSYHKSGTQDQCRAGLAAMAADEYLELFAKMHRIMAHDPKRAEAIQQGGGFGEIDPAIKALDEQFFALNDKQPLQDMVAPWLKSRPNVVVLPEAEIEKILAARGQHPVARARLAEQAAAKLEQEANDPMVKMARKLCWSAGLEWQGWNAVFPTLVMEGKTYENVWSMSTDQGDCFMAEYEPRKAALFGIRDMPEGEHAPDELFPMPEYERMIVVATKGDLPWVPVG